VQLQLVSLQGQLAYEEVREFQKKWVELRAQDRVPDTFFFLEHSPVITQGRGLQFTGQSGPRHTPVPQQLPTGMDFCESERGGDLTYHGPGQLVIYPVVKLEGQAPWAPHHDINGFLRWMENWVFTALEPLGLRGEAHENATGVWVRPDSSQRSELKKLASIGIAVRKWVTYHGIAINAVNSLEPFGLIAPCGFSPEVMIRLKDLLPNQAELQSSAWRSWLEDRLTQALRLGINQTAISWANIKLGPPPNLTKNSHLPQGWSEIFSTVDGALAKID